MHEIDVSISYKTLRKIFILQHGDLCLEPLLLQKTCKRQGRYLINFQVILYIFLSTDLIFMYNFVQFLNVFFSKIAGAVFTLLHMGPSVERVLAMCLNRSMPLNKMAAMFILVKTLKTFLLQNRQIFKAESGYTASRTQGLPMTVHVG